MQGSTKCQMLVVSWHLDWYVGTKTFFIVLKCLWHVSYLETMQSTCCWCKGHLLRRRIWELRYWSRVVWRSKGSGTMINKSILDDVNLLHIVRSWHYVCWSQKFSGWKYPWRWGHRYRRNPRNRTRRVRYSCVYDRVGLLWIMFVPVCHHIKQIPEMPGWGRLSWYVEVNLEISQDLDRHAHLAFYMTMRGGWEKKRKKRIKNLKNLSSAVYGDLQTIMHG